MQNFEELFQKGHKTGAEAETTWDLRAEKFNSSQQRDNSKTPGLVTDLLLKKGLLTGKDVLDAGGGTGRYAVPFARYAKTVTIADVSSNMLGCAKKNAENAGLNNIQYIKSDWDAADLSTLGWDRHFDFVFSSMCPATRCKEGIDKMIAASKGWCALNHVTVSEDSLLKSIKNCIKQKKPQGYNGKENVQATFNYLWVKGYEPEIEYIKEEKEHVYSIDEAVNYYSRSSDSIGQDCAFDWKDAIMSYAAGGFIKINNRSTHVIISWRV